MNGEELTAIWPEGAAVSMDGEMSFYGVSASKLLEQFGSPLYLMDVDQIQRRAKRFAQAATDSFNTTTTRISYAGKAFLSKEIVRLVTGAGLLVDTCSMGEMRIALEAGIPGRRLVLHGNNKSDEEISLAIEQGFAKIVIDEPSEPKRIAAIARGLGKRARVMLRVTTGVHAGGHEYISTAHEDQKFGVPLLPRGVDAGKLEILDQLTAISPALSNIHFDDLVDDTSDGEVGAIISDAGAFEHREQQLRHDIRYPYDVEADEISPVKRALSQVMEMVADGPAFAVLEDISSHGRDLELVGIHSHIGSQIHDVGAFIQAAKRMMLLRKTFCAAKAYVLPEVDLGGGYSVAYTDDEDSMDIETELDRLAQAVGSLNRTLGMPVPIMSFEPGRWIVAPAGVTLYRVGTVKHLALPVGSEDAQGNEISERWYVSVDGGMSDNIRPALYGADYAARLVNRVGSDKTMLSRVVGSHCESGDILVRQCQLPTDLRRGDILATPVTGAYGRTMASNYNQACIPAVVAVSRSGPHLMMRRQTVDDLLSLDVG